MLSRFSERNQRKALMKRQHWSTTPMHPAVSVPSVLQSEKSLPRKLHNVQLHLTQHACIESKESSDNDDGNNDGDNSDDGSNDDGGDDDGDKIRDYPSQNISKDETRKEAHTMGEHLEDLEHEAVLVHQNILQSIPRFALHILCDHSKLQEASAELTKELKKGDLDVLVCVCVTAMIGLLNIYTDQNLKYSWKRALEVVAKTQGSGMNRA